MIDSYRKQNKSIPRRTSSPKKSSRDQTDDVSSVRHDTSDKEDQINDDEEEEKEKAITPTAPATVDYWYPPKGDEKTKITITDITSDNVTITFRELI